MKEYFHELITNYDKSYKAMNFHMEIIKIFFCLKTTVIKKNEKEKKN